MNRASQLIHQFRRGLILVSLFSHSVPATLPEVNSNICGTALKAGLVVLPTSKTRHHIGVLVKFKNGKRKFLGTEYFGFHADLLMSLPHDDIEEVLWGGEMQIRILPSPTAEFAFEILNVNETSGTLAKLMAALRGEKLPRRLSNAESKLIESFVARGIRVRSSVVALMDYFKTVKPEVLTELTRPLRFDEKEPYLIPLLNLLKAQFNGIAVDAYDVRHELRNEISPALLTIKLIEMDSAEYKRNLALDRFAANDQILQEVMESWPKNFTGERVVEWIHLLETSVNSLPDNLPTPRLRALEIWAKSHSNLRQLVASLLADQGTLGADLCTFFRVFDDSLYYNSQRLIVEISE